MSKLKSDFGFSARSFRSNPKNIFKTNRKHTLVAKIKRKLRILLCKMPVFDVHFGQDFLLNSVKFLHWPRANDQSYHLWKYQYLVSLTYQCNPGLMPKKYIEKKNFLQSKILNLRLILSTGVLPKGERSFFISYSLKTKKKMIFFSKNQFKIWKYCLDWSAKILPRLDFTAFVL